MSRGKNWDYAKEYQQERQEDLQALAGTIILLAEIAAVRDKHGVSVETELRDIRTLAERITGRPPQT